MTFSSYIICEILFVIWKVKDVRRDYPKMGKEILKVAKVVALKNRAGSGYLKGREI
jgi:hypothetical protein